MGGQVVRAVPGRWPRTTLRERPPGTGKAVDDATARARLTARLVIPLSDGTGGNASPGTGGPGW